MQTRKKRNSEKKKRKRTPMQTCYSASNWFKDSESTVKLLFKLVADSDSTTKYELPSRKLNDYEPRRMFRDPVSEPERIGRVPEVRNFQNPDLEAEPEPLRRSSTDLPNVTHATLQCLPAALVGSHATQIQFLGECPRSTYAKREYATLSRGWCNFTNFIKFWIEPFTNQRLRKIQNRK